MDILIWFGMLQPEPMSNFYPLCFNSEKTGGDENRNGTEILLTISLNMAEFPLIGSQYFNAIANCFHM